MPKEANLEASHRLMHALFQVQAELLTQEDPLELFERLLHLVLEETRSEYGFIAEILHPLEGPPSLRTYALTHTSWADEQRRASQGVELRDTEALLDELMRTGQPLMTHHGSPPSTTLGFPEGLPPMRAFLCMPFRVHGVPVGVVGVANRPGGYEPGHIEFLQPLLTTCGLITRALHDARRQRDTEQALASLRELASGISNDLVTATTVLFGTFEELNNAFRVLLELLGLYQRWEQRLGSPPPESVAELLEQVRTLGEKEHLEDLIQFVQPLLEGCQPCLDRIRECAQGLKLFQSESSDTSTVVVDLNHVLQAVLRQLRLEQKERWEIHTELTPLPPLRCFPLQLHKLFLILVLITQDSAQQGEMRVTSTQHGKELVVRMSNPAFVIPEEWLAAPSPFPTHPTTAETRMSLQMSICRVIIDRHHGRLTVEGESGKGITFTVRLPLGTSPSHST